MSVRVEEEDEFRKGWISVSERRREWGLERLDDCERKRKRMRLGKVG